MRAGVDSPADLGGFFLEGFRIASGRRRTFGFCALIFRDTRGLVGMSSVGKWGGREWGFAVYALWNVSTAELIVTWILTLLS